MAEINNTAFEVKVSNHEFDSVANITGLFQNGSGAAEACAAGFLCVTDELVQNEGYPTGVLNGNTWIMNAANNVLPGTAVYACNTFNVNELADPVTGEVYKVNGNTLGLPIPAGKLGTYTRIDFTGDCIYRFGVGNFTAAPEVGTSYYISNGMLAPIGEGQSIAPGSGNKLFTVLRTGTFTQGAWAAFGWADVKAIKA